MRHAVKSPLRAVLISIQLLGQAVGLRLAREASGRHPAAATILDLRVALARAEQEIEWLTARLARVSPLAVILDAFARRPLAWRVFAQTPTARQMTRLLQTAFDRCGRPRHLISDRGVQFTAKTFRRRLRRHRIGHRLGAVGRSGSIALIERFWRTIKDAARVRGRPPLSAVTLEARLRLTLGWYTTVRPHSAFAGGTPAEVYRGPSHPAAARSPPRGRWGDGPRHTPFTVVFVDSDRTLPVLVRRAA